MTQVTFQEKPPNAKKSMPELRSAALRLCREALVLVAFGEVEAARRRLRAVREIATDWSKNAQGETSG